MTALTVSVIIVSRGRSEVLKRCLTGVSQLQYPSFEVVVVADPKGITAAQTLPFAPHLRLVPFDKANISAARNLGVTHAAGEIVAFIDDDAVPEPTWLQHLVAAADRPDVAAMGGFVRGRNGISFQWRARSLDRWGAAHDLDVHARQPTVLQPPKGRAIKTEGTNMGFRRDVLVALGGFDPAFHYFLDETDLNMRLARAGYATAIVPLAEVHHGYAANTLRASNRVPTDLFDIGASWAVFQRKHVDASEREIQWRKLRAEQRLRLLRYLVEGPLEPRAVRHLLGRLDRGYAEGSARPLDQGRLAAHPAAPFLPFPSPTRKAGILVSRPIRLRRDRRTAAEKVRSGENITLFCLSPTIWFHKVSYEPGGFWLQKGGIYGRSDRKMPLFRIFTRSGRVKKEQMRVATQRGLREE